MSFGSIYKIQFPNGKHYIGLTTTSLQQRGKEHKKCAKSGDKRCLYNAIRKCDIVETFELIEIDTADTIEELCEKEIRYIAEYNSYYMNGNGYNMTYGGEGTNGYVFTEQDNKKNSERRKQYYENNPEAIERMSESLKLHYENNPEARERMSEIKRQYYENNPEAKEKNIEVQKKYHKEHPEASKEHGEKMKQYYENNPEAKQQLSESHKKYHENNPGARERMSELKKQYYENNPEAKQQLSESHKKYHENNPEVGKEYGEKMKQYYENNPEARQQMSKIKEQYYKNNPEARQKLSDGKGKNKPFDVFTIDSTFIKTFTYQFEAKEYLQKKHHITSTINIGSVLSGKRKSSAGFVFKYK
jgi:hypothetical protein